MKEQEREDTGLHGGWRGSLTRCQDGQLALVYKGNRGGHFRSLFEMAKQAQTVKNEEKAEWEKKRSALKSQNKHFAQRERKKVNRESLFQGLTGFHFGPCCYQQYGLELSFRDYLKEV